MLQAPCNFNADRTVVDALGASPKAVSAACRDACLIHIYPSGPSMGRRYPLSAGSAVLIGRGGDCAISIDDQSVSRRHAHIELTAQGFLSQDLNSTNGTFVNDRPISRQLLRDGDYLRVGNSIYRFLAGGNIEAEYHEEIYRLAIIDALTEIPNKRYLMEFLGRELARAQRHQRSLSLLLFDIDRFKAINDGHGHLCGDHVLREMAQRLKTTIRSDELLARYGGEEFAVVLPECAREDALGVGERVRTLVASHRFRFDGQPIPVTVSVGVASVASDEPIRPDELIDRADEKLYEAKRGGRNRVCG